MLNNVQESAVYLPSAAAAKKHHSSGPFGGGVAA